MIKYDSHLGIFYSTKVNDPRFFSGFSTKGLGDGRKAETIINFINKIPLNFNTIVIPEQIHSVNIEVYQSSSTSNIVRIADCDGVITQKNNCLLTVRTADCLPIIFLEKETGLIGISHQGWRGSLKKMAIKMVQKMVEQGASLNKILVAIGPGIGPCCYQIDVDRFNQFLEEFNGFSSDIFQFHAGRYSVDLTRLNFLLLQKAGVKKENIDFFPFCTACDKKRFFSFRRDKNKDYAEMFHFIMKIDKPKLFNHLN